MRLCHVVPSLEARYGGPSKSVLELSAALAQAGNEVELLATEPGPGEIRSEGPLAVRIFHRNWPANVCRSSALRLHLQGIGAEVIHHHSLWLRTLHYSHRTAVRLGAPLVISPRGMMSQWAWEHHRRRKRVAHVLVHPGALAAARGWHATSKEEAGEIRARGFTQPICVAPNGVGRPAEEQMTAAARHWHEACPETAERRVALFYSRFHRKKRVLELIDSWLEHGPRDWLLLMVGLPSEYGASMLENYVLRASGAGRVRAFSGAGRPAPYAVASLFLLPSHNENFGLAIAEAMAAGVPALVTDTTPWTALNENGGGWCVPWAGYARTLRAATAETPDQLRARGAVARDWVLREYSWETPARALAEFYAQLVRA